jgi:hypothetical protein
MSVDHQTLAHEKEDPSRVGVSYAGIWGMVLREKNAGLKSQILVREMEVGWQIFG